MSRYDLVVRGGTIVSETGAEVTDIAVNGEQIVSLEPEMAGTGREEIDAAGLHVFPGVIDAHVHFNEPGRTDWEGWATGTRALAAGGATSCFDMPLNAHPPTVNGASFDVKRAAAEASAVTDFALWGGLVPSNLDRLDELAERGVVGLKAFMSNSGIDDFTAIDDLTLYDGMARAARLGLIVAVHAENDAITAGLAARAVTSGRVGARAFLASRPVIAEVEAISRAILFAEETGCALHVVHVSTGRGVTLVAEARARGVDVSCETCPHYLVFTEEDLETLGAVAKCAPPLRPAAEQETLWDHLRAGEVPMVTSDHSPASADLKTGDDFFQMWGGISGCQSTLSVLLTEGYHARHVSLTTIAAVTAGNVASRFGVARKGRIDVGADADLALIALGERFVLEPESLFYRHRHSPYVGRNHAGRVVRTILRGTTTFLNGAIVASPCGRLLQP